MAEKAGLKKTGSEGKRLLSWANLILLLLLTAFSIYGAFIGADKAKAFFNSVPLAVYWIAFLILLGLAILIFKRLLCRRGLFITHLGCIVVLIGGIIGSQAGFRIQDKWFKTDTIRKGQMIIRIGTTDSAVDTEAGETKTLPFSLKLDNFRIEYYQPGQLIITTLEGEGFKVDAETGHKYELGNNLGSVEIVRKFEYFKMLLEEGKRTAIDDPNGGANPALEVRLKKPDGTETTRYVFARFPGHARPGDNLQLSYHRAVKDFISDVEVIKDNKVVSRKSIEVNKPLHYGGYLFYQQGYDNEAGRYTILSVTSDKGLGIVFLGYILLCIGVFWHFWFRHIFGDREIED